MNKREISICLSHLKDIYEKQESIIKKTLEANMYEETIAMLDEQKAIEKLIKELEERHES